MKAEELYTPIREKYDELKKALQGTDIEKIRELTLEVHAMVHPAEISGRTEKTIADYVLEYMLLGNQNEIVPREDYDVDLHYAGTRKVPLCWQFGKSDIGSDTIYGTGRMGNENIGRRRSDYRFPLGLVISVLGKIDEGRYDFNTHYKSSYDAFTALSESFTDFRLIDSNIVMEDI